MRARKVAILLAITAISALTLFIVVLADSDALGAPPPAAAPGTASIFFGPNGKPEVEFFDVLGEGGPSDLRFSLARQDAREFTNPFGPLSLAASGAISRTKEGR